MNRVKRGCEKTWAMTHVTWLSSPPFFSLQFLSPWYGRTRDEHLANKLVFNLTSANHVSPPLGQGKPWGRPVCWHQSFRRGIWIKRRDLVRSLPSDISWELSVEEHVPQTKIKIRLWRSKHCSGKDRWPMPETRKTSDFSDNRFLTRQAQSILLFLSFRITKLRCSRWRSTLCGDTRYVGPGLMRFSEWEGATRWHFVLSEVDLSSLSELRGRRRIWVAGQLSQYEGGHAVSTSSICTSHTVAAGAPKWWSQGV